jgi:hypothetical protein
VRRTFAVVLVALGVLLVGGPAGAGPIIDDPDAIELANALGDAADEHGICYGWEISIDDRGALLEDVGSNFGPGVSVQTAACPKYIVFWASYRWTSESSESEDSVSFGVSANVAGAPLARDLERVGITGGALLDRDDITVYNATLALVALASEAGLGPPIAFEQNVGTIPSTDKPDQVDSDWMREYGSVIATFAMVIAGGVIWLLYELVVRPIQLRHQQR